MDWITNWATRYITENIFEQYKEKEDTLQTRTEFMNADWFVINPWWVAKHLLTIQTKNKPIAQLFWWRKENLLKATKLLIENFSESFSWIELNTWCPSNTVMKCWGGSDMLKHRPETLDIIKELSIILKDSWMTFSVKSRAGLNEEDKQEQLKFLIEVSKVTDFITIHWRTLKQLYMWEADFSFIKKVKENAACPVIANWWINSYEQASEIVKNFDWIMIGQWAIGNPWVFTKHQPTLDEKIDTIKKHLKLMITTEFWFEKYIKPMEWYSFPQPSIEELETLEKDIDYTTPYHSIVEFRKYAFQYLKGIPCSREIKQWILQKKTFNEMLEILSLLKNK